MRDRQQDNFFYISKKIEEARNIKGERETDREIHRERDRESDNRERMIEREKTQKYRNRERLTKKLIEYMGRINNRVSLNRNHVENNAWHRGTNILEMA